MGDVSRFGLQQEKQVSVFLSLVVVREEALLHIGGGFEVARDFVLLQ